MRAGRRHGKDVPEKSPFKQSLPFIPTPEMRSELKDFEWLFDSVVYYTLLNSLPPGKFNSMTKLLKRWTQMSDFIDFFPSQRKLDKK